jgi:glutathione peroxidase
MKSLIFIGVIIAVVFALYYFFMTKPAQSSELSGKTAYDFSFKKIEGGDMPLSEFKGKVIMVVNTASLCGFTGQFKDLQELYDKYESKGLVIVGVPANDFGGQEPKNNSEIKTFCETKFAVTFPLTEKEKVTGDNAHPFYKWAAQSLGMGSKPKWNFHKYLIDRNGKLVDYFNSPTSPTSDRVKNAIEKLL